LTLPTPQELAAVQKLAGQITAEAYHPKLVEAAEKGDFTIVDVLDSLPWFRSAASWKSWRAFLCALYGLPMDQEELAIFRACTGRIRSPTRKAEEAWVAAGRRSRKSAIMSLIGVWEGGFRDHSKNVAPGEPPRVMVTSKDKDDAQTIHSFTKGILGCPATEHLLRDDISERITLSNTVEIVTRAAKLTAGRSKTIVCALLDEIAFWPTDESATPDTEILRGIRPAMANVKQPLLVAMSSPYARRGELYTNIKKHWGKDDDPVLVWMAPTEVMHATPEIRGFVAKEWAKDPVSAASEVGNIERGITFRADVQAFITEELLDSVIKVGVKERPPVPGVQYWAFCDASGGTVDSFTLSIAHVEYPQREAPLTGLVPKPRVVQDYLRDWPAPYNPLSVVKETVPILHRYGLRFVKGDKYAGNWPVAAYAQYGIGYQQADKTRSDYYLESLPLMSSDQVELLDIPRAKTQWLGLDRKVSRSGHETVDHGPGAHDDLCNSSAGSLVESSVGLRLPPPKPVVTYQKPDGTIDWERLNRDQLKKRMEEARYGPDDDPGVPERYSYR
jgi:hypothetical protein